METDLRREFKYQEKELRKIINSWDLIPGSPNDEFDSLNHKLLGHLGRVADEKKISKVIYSELIVTFGLDIEQSESNGMAAQVMDWWMNRNS